MSESTRSPNVGFRISEVYFEQLAERARRSGMSVHSLARYLVIQALEESLVHTVLDEVRALRERLENAIEGNS